MYLCDQKWLTVIKLLIWQSLIIYNQHGLPGPCPTFKIKLYALLTVFLRANIGVHFVLTRETVRRRTIYPQLKSVCGVSADVFLRARIEAFHYV